MTQTAGAKDEDEDHTIHRGLDPYPEDKDRQNAGGSGATSGSAGVDKGNEVLIMNAKNEDRTTSFFSQPGILAGKKQMQWRVCAAVCGAKNTQ